METPSQTAMRTLPLQARCHSVVPFGLFLPEPGDLEISMSCLRGPLHIRKWRGRCSWKPQRPLSTIGADLRHGDLIYGTRVAEVIPRAIPAIDEVVVHIMSDLLLFFDLGIGRELLVLRVLRVVA